MTLTKEQKRAMKSDKKKKLMKMREYNIIRKEKENGNAGIQNK